MRGFVYFCRIVVIHIYKLTYNQNILVRLDRFFQDLAYTVFQKFVTHSPLVFCFFGSTKPVMQNYQQLMLVKLV